MISLLADDLVILRYVEIEKQFRKVLAVARMRGSDHNEDFPEYEITEAGFELPNGLTGYTGGVSGAPQLLPPAGGAKRSSIGPATGGTGTSHPAVG